MRNLIKWLLVLYLMACLMVSWFVSSGMYEVIEHRQGLVVVEIDTVTINEPGNAIGTNGAPIGYPEDIPVGARVVSVFLWNPLNNYCDDIIGRWDIASWTNE